MISCHLFLIWYSSTSGLKSLQGPRIGVACSEIPVYFLKVSAHEGDGKWFALRRVLLSLKDMPEDGHAPFEVLMKTENE